VDKRERVRNVNGFVWNAFLAVVWLAITGSFSPGNLAFGFGLGFLVLVFAGPVIGSANYAPRVLRAAELIGFFLWDLFLSNLSVSSDVIRPRLRLQPGVIAIPLDVKTDVEIVLLANLITVTPGSLSLDVSADRQVLYLHVMHFEDPEAVRHKIKNGFERRILAVFR
jgi:multicomponent Na+:H+ antiporter subunit E